MATILVDLESENPGAESAIFTKMKSGCPSLNRTLFAFAPVFAVGLSVLLIISGCGSNSSSRAGHVAKPVNESSVEVTAPGENPSTQPTPVTDAVASNYSAAVNAALTSGDPAKFRNLDTGYGATSAGAPREVKCAKGVSCRGRYVRVGIFGKKRGSCAGVRIARDLVVTNRHCAEVIVDSANSQFNGKMNLSIPEDRFRKKRSIPISNLVMISPESDADRNPDWAILKISSSATNIEESNLPRISRAGIKPGEVYNVLTMAADANDRRDLAPLEIRSQKCIGAYPNIFFPMITSSSDAVISLSGCNIGPGDSGSPIFNSRGELVGIVAGQMKSSILLMSGIVANMHGASDVPVPGTFRDSGWGTSFACIPDVDSLKKEIPATCGKEIENPSTIVQLPSGIEAKLRAALSVGDIPHPQFRYEVYRSNPAPGDATIAVGSAAFAKVPYCVSRAGLQLIKAAPIKVPASIASVILDRDGVPTANVGPVVAYPTATLDVDLEKLKNTGVSPLKVYAVDADFVLYRGTLRICD